MKAVLPDYLRRGLKVVLVGINPGRKSAELGHHFAGPGNRFWDLLAATGLTPSKLHYREDGRLLDHGIGLTNIVARPSRSSSELRSADFVEGRQMLARKIEHFQPQTVGFVGVTVFREFWPELSNERAPREILCGKRTETLGKTCLFVLPNPSGRNAHYSYDEMLQCWKKLARWVKKSNPDDGARTGDHSSPSW